MTAIADVLIGAGITFCFAWIALVRGESRHRLAIARWESERRLVSSRVVALRAQLQHERRKAMLDDALRPGVPLRYVVPRAPSIPETSADPAVPEESGTVLGLPWIGLAERARLACAAQRAQYDRGRCFDILCPACNPATADQATQPAGLELLS